MTLAAALPHAVDIALALAHAHLIVEDATASPRPTLARAHPPAPAQTVVVVIGLAATAHLRHRHVEPVAVRRLERVVHAHLSQGGAAEARPLERVVLVRPPHGGTAAASQPTRAVRARRDDEVIEVSRKMGDKEAGRRHLRDGTQDSGGIQVPWSRRGEKDEGIDTAHRRGEGGIVQLRAITHGAHRGEAVEEIDQGRRMRQVRSICSRSEFEHVSTINSATLVQLNRNP